MDASSDTARRVSRETKWLRQNSSRVFASTTWTDGVPVPTSIRILCVTNSNEGTFATTAFAMGSDTKATFESPWRLHCINAIRILGLSDTYFDPTQNSARRHRQLEGYSQRDRHSCLSSDHRAPAPFRAGHADKPLILQRRARAL